MTKMTNPLGVHGAVWTGSVDAVALNDAIAKTKSAGFDLIEVPLLDPWQIDADAVARSLRTHGVQATASLVLAADHDISSDDEDTAQRGERLLVEAVTRAGDFGATFLGGVTYSKMGKYDTPPSADQRKRSAARLARVAALAEKRGLKLGIEPANRYETNLVNTGAQACELIALAGSPNLYVHLDCYHMNIEENDFARAVSDCGDRLAYFHVGESHRGYLGTGSIDFPTVFRALVAAGYDGPVTFESFSSRVASDFAVPLSIWRDQWADGEAVARHAAQFLRAGLDAAKRTADAW